LLISNSEVNSFNACQRRHYYSFREKLAPKFGYSVAITRGVVGHDALAEYYERKQRGERKEVCLVGALSVVDSHYDAYPDLWTEFDQLKRVITRYVEHYQDENWIPFEVERQHELLLDNRTGLSYGMRLDLLAEVKGSLILVDHKFVYNFFTDKELAMSAQLQKYLHTLNKNGIPVKTVVVNQIRYRELKNPNSSKLFKRSYVHSTEYERERTMDEHKKVAKDILELKERPQEEHFYATRMSLDKWTCGSCSFQPLCKDYLQGNLNPETKKNLFKTNDYLYDKEVV
jgi:CRISPR/Cas system-associated exonuclease Cas4 (RecB family)